jgi:xanthine dehydrogenase accessory factor
MNPAVLILGAGDLATGVAIRLHRAGIQLVMTELSQPLVVRRSVAFAQAVFDGQMSVEDVEAQRTTHESEIESILTGGRVAVMVDPDASLLKSPPGSVRFSAVVDARLRKRPPEIDLIGQLAVGLGPGFTPGMDCDAVVETMRGHHLGRVYWNHPAQADTGQPEAVRGQRGERVLRAPSAGVLQAKSAIGDLVRPGQVVAEVDEHAIKAPFAGVLRGLVMHGLTVSQGMKVGDVDPRQDPSYCTWVSDKALAVGGGVLEALLTREKTRQLLWA